MIAPLLIFALDCLESGLVYPSSYCIGKTGFDNAIPGRFLENFHVRLDQRRPGN